MPFWGPLGLWQAGWVGLPQGPAKDTGLNVGSHDVTGDVEVDADEFALPTGKHRKWSVPRAQPLTHSCRQVGRDMAESIRGAGGTPQPRSLTGNWLEGTTISELR